MCNSSANDFPANDQNYVEQVIVKRVAGTHLDKYGWVIHFQNGFIGFLPYEDAVVRPEVDMRARIYTQEGGTCNPKIRGLWLNNAKCFYEPLPAKPIKMEFTPEELAVIYMVTGKITGGIDDTARKFTEDVYLKICSLWPDLHHISQSGATRGNQVNFHFTRDSFQIVKEIAKKFK